MERPLTDAGGIFYGPVRPQWAGRDHLALMIARSAASILRIASPRRVCSSARSLRRAPVVVGRPLGGQRFHFTVDCRALRLAAFKIAFKGRPQSVVFRPPQLGYSRSQPRKRVGAIAVYLTVDWMLRCPR